MDFRSQRILTRPRWSKVRALFKSMGYSDTDLSRPLIGIANSWNRLVPGHYNLRRVAEYTAQGIYQAGGTPVEFGVMAACDGVASAHEGGRYILPSRELIAGSIETMVEAHRLDGVVMLGSCDKIVKYDFTESKHKAYEKNGTATSPIDYDNEANTTEYEYLNESDNDRWMTSFADDDG